MDKVITDTQKPGASGGDSLADAELRPTTAALLAYLETRVGQTVSKSELMDALWPDTNVTENSLYQVVSELRRALVDQPGVELKTVPRRGYRLVRHRANACVRDLSHGGPGARWPMLPALVVAIFALIMVGAGGWLWFDRMAPVPMAERPSVRVEAFRNDSGDADWDALGRAMAGEIGTTLSAARWLRVVEGAEAKASYRLTGSYHANGDRVLVQARLIEEDSGALVWSRSWDGVQAAFFDLQAEVAHDAAAELGGHWSGGVVRFDARKAVRRPTDSLDAYALYLRGAQAKHRFTAEGVEEARQLLTRAVEIDPAYVDAWTTLSVVHNIRALTEPDPARLERILDERRRAVETAIALAPEEPIVLMEQARLLSLKGDYEASRQAVRRAVALAPENPDILAYGALAGNLHVDLGQEGVAWTDKALGLNPDPPPWYFVGAGLARFSARDWTGAVEAFERAPDYATRDLFAAVALMQLGRDNEARATAARLSERDPGFRTSHYVYQEGMDMSVNGGLLIDTATELGLPRGDYFNPPANAAASSDQRP